ncbi:hypothetical protein L6452_11821 [Arctium lappa]|uniref:Uncharacterized protein n=1 Tax=Arctium lappa TaxID=4217 RepID=A0ACB9DPY8_ARCLA|nr:hypothetical protein L6452_11821 [Arctium lappa]
MFITLIRGIQQATRINHFCFNLHCLHLLLLDSLLLVLLANSSTIFVDKSHGARRPFDDPTSDVIPFCSLPVKYPNYSLSNSVMDPERSGLPFKKAGLWQLDGLLFAGFVASCSSPRPWIYLTQGHCFWTIMTNGALAVLGMADDPQEDMIIMKSNSVDGQSPTLKFCTELFTSWEVLSSSPLGNMMDVLLLALLADHRDLANSILAKPMHGGKCNQGIWQWQIQGEYTDLCKHYCRQRLCERDLQFPFMALLISGGHNLLVLAHDLGHYLQLGTTIDDAIVLFGVDFLSKATTDAACSSSFCLIEMLLLMSSLVKLETVRLDNDGDVELSFLVSQGDLFDHSETVKLNNGGDVYLSFPK